MAILLAFSMMVLLAFAVHASISCRMLVVRGISSLCVPCIGTVLNSTGGKNGSNCCHLAAYLIYYTCSTFLQAPPAGEGACASHVMASFDASCTP
jgi:hypothetical protein